MRVAFVYMFVLVAADQGTIHDSDHQQPIPVCQNKDVVWSVQTIHEAFPVRYICARLRVHPQSSISAAILLRASSVTAYNKDLGFRLNLSSG